MGQAQRVLETVAIRFGHTFSFESHLMGGCAIDACGNPIPDETLEACKASDTNAHFMTQRSRPDELRASRRSDFIVSADPPKDLTRDGESTCLLVYSPCPR